MSRWAWPLALLGALQTAQAGALDNALPPADAVLQTLGRLPSVRAAEAGRTEALGRQQRLQAGPHDWTLKLGAQRRQEQAGPRFNEQEFGLERSLRSPAKAATDRQLGKGERLLGDLRHADAWHEAARGLLAGWFGWLREWRSAQVLAAQAALAGQQQAVAAKRLRAGDAARLELLLAQAELDRALATAAQAAQKADLSRAELARRLPGLPLNPPHPLPEPEADGLGVDAWVARILDDNHELELAQAQAELARQRATRAGQERLGDPLLGLRASRERGGQEQVLGVYLALPLGSGARAADAQVALAQAEAAQQAEAEVRSRVENAALRVATEAVQRPGHWRTLQAVQLGLQQAAALAERGYALGETPLSEALLARRSALDAELAAENARLDALEAQARAAVDAHRLWQPPGGHHPAMVNGQ